MPKSSSFKTYKSMAIYEGMGLSIYRAWNSNYFGICFINIHTEIWPITNSPFSSKKYLFYVSILPKTSLGGFVIAETTKRKRKLLELQMRRCVLTLLSKQESMEATCIFRQTACNLRLAWKSSLSAICTGTDLVHHKLVKLSADMRPGCNKCGVSCYLQISLFI